MISSSMKGYVSQSSASYLYSLRYKSVGIALREIPKTRITMEHKKEVSRAKAVQAKKGFRVIDV